MKPSGRSAVSMLPMVLAAVISAVRSVWFVDPVTGYDNGTMPRLWWTVAVLLCAVTTALLYRADRPPGRPAGKRTGGCFGVAGALCLVGGGALLAGLPNLIYRVTGIKTNVAKMPLDCVALGIGRVIESPEKTLGDSVSYRTR